MSLRPLASHDTYFQDIKKCKKGVWCQDHVAWY